MNFKFQGAGRIGVNLWPVVVQISVTWFWYPMLFSRVELTLQELQPYSLCRINGWKHMWDQILSMGHSVALRKNSSRVLFEITTNWACKPRWALCDRAAVSDREKCWTSVPRCVSLKHECRHVQGANTQGYTGALSARVYSGVDISWKETVAQPWFQTEMSPSFT